MKRYVLTHLSDESLPRALAAAVAAERSSTADLLAHLAEVDARKLYLPAAYPSLYAYCVGELHMSEDAAYKRIQAARAARRFPAILDALASGGLSLIAVVRLAPYLREENLESLVAAATHKTKAEIEQLLAERFPRPDLPDLVAAIPATPAQPAPTGETVQLVPEPVREPSRLASPTLQAPLDPAAADSRSRVKPLAPQRYAVQFTMSQSAHDKLGHVQELLGHQVASGDLAAVFERALDALIPELERRRFAATERPRRRPGRASKNPRHVPDPVRRAVWQRDQGQCTFVSESGHRCEARRFLELDHEQEIARGGESTAANLRLRCRAHNQYAAERTFGAEFMRHKRIAATEAREAARAAPHDR